MDELEQALARIQRLEQTLNNTQSRPVLGLMDALGSGMGRAGGDSQWTWTLTLSHWKFADDSVDSGLQNGPLTLRMKVDDKDRGAYQKLVQPYGIYRLQASVVQSPEWPAAQGLLQALPDAAQDSELQAHADRLQLPVTLTDAVFGVMELDRRFSCFEAEALWLNQPVTISLDAADEQPLPKVMACAHRLWQQQPLWQQRLEQIMLDELLALKNECWLDDDDAPVDSAGFLSRVTLQTISIDSDGGLDFWFSDGDLFWGHSIQVSADIDSGCHQAGIAG